MCIDGDLHRKEGVCRLGVQHLREKVDDSQLLCSMKWVRLLSCRRASERSQRSR